MFIKHSAFNYLYLIILFELFQDSAESDNNSIGITRAQNGLQFKAFNNCNDVQAKKLLCFLTNLKNSEENSKQLIDSIIKEINVEETNVSISALVADNSEDEPSEIAVKVDDKLEDDAEKTEIGMKADENIEYKVSDVTQIITTNKNYDVSDESEESEIRDKVVENDGSNDEDSEIGEKIDLE